MSDIEEHAQRAQLGWAPAYGRFARVLRERDLRTGLEVGVAFGGHSESILEQSSVEILCGVDPYTKRSAYADIVVAQSYFDEIHDFAVEGLSTFGPRFSRSCPGRDRLRLRRRGSPLSGGVVGPLPLAPESASGRGDWRTRLRPL